VHVNLDVVLVQGLVGFRACPGALPSEFEVVVVLSPVSVHAICKGHFFN